LQVLQIAYIQDAHTDFDANHVIRVTWFLTNTKNAIIGPILNGTQKIFTGNNFNIDHAHWQMALIIVIVQVLYSKREKTGND